LIPPAYALTGPKTIFVMFLEAQESIPRNRSPRLCSLACRVVVPGLPS
jgi:hypothetical protein